MSYLQLNSASTLLDRYTLKNIQNCFLNTFPIYTKLALDIIQDEEIPPKYTPWVNLLDIYAIQTNRYGYFEIDNVLTDFATELKTKLLAFKTHKDIKEFILNLYAFETGRQASINQYVKDNNCLVIES